MEQRSTPDQQQKKLARHLLKMCEPGARRRSMQVHAVVLAAWRAEAEGAGARAATAFLRAASARKRSGGLLAREGGLLSRYAA